MSAAGILAGLFLLLALYCGLDPYQLSPLRGFPDFKAYRVDFAPWSQLTSAQDPENKLQRAEVRFLNQVQGPESVAFDPLGRGPYTGVADGRILFWNGESWSDFAYTSSNRSELCGPKPSPLAYTKNEHICGRPLGLRFDKKTGELYIADAYFGLMKVGPEGGLAKPLVKEVEGVPLMFTNDLDIDDDGAVYFTDSSSVFQRRNFMQLVFSGEHSGRLFKYDPVKMETTVLVRNLAFPNGVSLSKDKSFIVFSECTSGRLNRYWLKGEKAGTTDIFAVTPGIPDNVRTNANGEFWVGLHCRISLYAYVLGLHPRLRTFILRLPIPLKYHYMLYVGGRPHGIVAKFNVDGQIMEVLEDKQGKVVKSVSEVEEKDGKLWMGSVLMPFIAVF
ncbi:STRICTOSIDINE SYNTHASE-LIKE 3 protein [Nymphaea thermarum]|nr:STRICTOSIDINE SYNTHASE-LIKE 3 protein [Nymphaea thermarum]